MKLVIRIFSVLGFLALAGAISLYFLLPPVDAAQKSLWVYTSIYKEYAAPIEAEFEKQNPEIDVQIFQAGSEKIQAKVEAELMAKKPQADIILTSDPFWSTELIQRNLGFAVNTKDPAPTNYYSLMVLISHRGLPAEKRPRSFQDLTRPEFKNLIQMGSPLESGTMFAMVAYLSQKYGWKYFEQLKQNEIAANGGNSTVIQKVESGEKKIGIVLLENALTALKRGSPLEIIYPADGAIPIPSLRVILNSSPQKEAATKFAAFIGSKAGQNLLRNGNMYGLDPKGPAPEGALPFKTVTAKSTAWTADRIQSVANQSKEIKKHFATLVLE